jgi:hypothetical protein
MATYKPLQSVVLTAATSSVTFSGIDQTYTDLVVVFNGSVSANEDFQIQVNSDTGSNYSRTWLTGNGTSATSSRSSTQTYMRLTQNGYLTTGNSNIVAQFMNYSNTTTNKTVLSRANNASTGTDAIVNLWRSTAAITSIYCYLPSGFFAVGSTFSLYGISPVNAKVASASGGTDIFYDSTYAYHVFKGTGVFVPTRALTADYIVVAGGGAGGANWGAGGGAGGFRTASSQSLTAGTSYTVTVGSGGSGVSAGKGTNGTDSTFNSMTSTGGGGAPGAFAGASGGGSAGGSGGGSDGRPSPSAGGAGNTPSTSPSQGNNGGGGYYGGGSQLQQGGGGGAGGAGVTGTSSQSGAGGVGTYSTLTDEIGAATGTGQLVSTHYYFAGGGGGGTGFGSAAAGGSGGGGTGVSVDNNNGVSGTTNTGGGGGGSGAGGSTIGGNGGSGIVIVRYIR